MEDSALEPLFMFIAYSVSTIQRSFNALPGSAVIVRYVKSSHQNDPFRTILEAILVIFAIRTLLQSRTRSDTTGKHFIKFTPNEIDELVDEWSPEPLVPALNEAELADLATVPVTVGPPGPKPKIQSTGKTAINLAGYNFAGLSGNDKVKDRAVSVLRNYGLGSCGPPGFYGTNDIHLDLERDIANFLGTEAAIIYSQGFSTISSVIPAFCKRGDIVIADRGVNFSIHKGLQISRSTVRWYDHNDLNSLEEVMQSVAKEIKAKRWRLTRRFIVTEGIFENDGAMSDLPKLVELGRKYKYRLILDESFSFGTVGRTGRGLTELYNVPANQIDLIVGSLANTLGACGGFCAGSRIAVNHQRINGTSFVFSAAMPGMLAMAASEGIQILTSTPSILSNLHTNIFTLRSVLDKIDCIAIPSHPASAIIHIQLRDPVEPAGNGLPTIARAVSRRPSNPTSLVPRDLVVFDIEAEEKLLQEVVDEALAQGVLITRARRLRGQEALEPRPSIKIAASAAVSKKDTEKAASILKGILIKVLGKK